jgi:hypothetical protein
MASRCFLALLIVFLHQCVVANCTGRFLTSPALQRSADRQFLRSVPTVSHPRLNLDNGLGLTPPMGLVSLSLSLSPLCTPSCRRTCIRNSCFFFTLCSGGELKPNSICHWIRSRGDDHYSLSLKNCMSTSICQFEKICAMVFLLQKVCVSTSSSWKLSER